jgi:3-oxoacyl-[acyl-carrier protein] reductase
MLETGLSGKVAVITGANNPHGIGAATALALAAQGARIVITYLQLPIPAEYKESEADQPGFSMYHRGRAASPNEVVHAIEEIGGEAIAIEADLADPNSITAIFDEAERVFDTVDIWVNNASHWEPNTFIPTTDTLTNDFSVQWMNNEVPMISPDMHDRIFAVNVRAVAHAMAEFAIRHNEKGKQWGRIINISTDAAWCFPSEIAYGASKLALESYSRSAASELGQFGITVNIISPGPIQTGYITEAMEAAIIENTPLKRVGKPDDVADAIVFLASKQARWITGQLIHVGGGHRM